MARAGRGTDERVEGEASARRWGRVKGNDRADQRSLPTHSTYCHDPGPNFEPAPLEPLIPSNPSPIGFPSFPGVVPVPVDWIELAVETLLIIICACARGLEEESTSIPPPIDGEGNARPKPELKDELLNVEGESNENPAADEERFCGCC